MSGKGEPETNLPCPHDPRGTCGRLLAANYSWKKKGGRDKLSWGGGWEVLTTAHSCCFEQILRPDSLLGSQARCEV